MGLALNLRRIVGQLLQLDVVGNGPQLKHNAGTLEVRNSTDTGYVITRGSDPVGNNDFVTKGAGDLAYNRVQNPNWLVTDWYIDGVTGDDTNSGTVIGSPIKTGEELLKRLGPYAIWPQSVTVHVLANGMIDALVLKGVMQVAGDHLDVVGTPTLVADCGTITTYTALNHATPTAPEISTTLIGDFTPYIWKRIRLTSGVDIGAVAWILASNPGGVGLQFARTERWSIPNTASTSSTLKVINPVIGVNAIIESLPRIPMVAIDIDGPLSQAAVPLYQTRLFSIESIDCPVLNIYSIATRSIYRGIIFACNLSIVQIGNINRPFGWFAPLVGCLLGCENVNLGSNWLIPLTAYACGFGNGITRAYANSGESDLYYCVFQGCVLNLTCAYVNAVDLQIFDSAIASLPALTINPGSFFFLNTGGLSGNGNAGYGIGLGDGSGMTSKTTVNLLGNISDGRFITTPTLNLTLPQLLQSSDYAKKGITPAMVAGTTTVTVPWYDNAAQRVTVNHAVFGGTPGILSVQQISTTQFTITSSSALDTSTVNWTISPLGRNIFISTT